MSIVVIGSSNTDLVLSVSHIPKPGETIIGHNFKQVAGGKGANQACAVASFCKETIFLATVGNDGFGKEAVTHFIKRGVNTDYIKEIPGQQSGIALIFVDDSAQNSIGVASGANSALSTDYIIENQKVIELAKYILVQLETPVESILEASRIAAANNIPFVLNPAPAPKNELPAELYKNTTLITPNETEAEILTGIEVKDEQSAIEAANVLRDKGVSKVIITLGKQGVFLSDGRIQKMISGYKVKAVDTTAAGDTFNGALVAALSIGKSMEGAINFANAAAAVSVTREGAQTSIPSMEEVESFLKENL
jgi:ribokinase